MVVAVVFSDEFTEAANTQLKNHVPNVGTGWVFVGANDDAFFVNSATNACRNGAGGQPWTAGIGYDRIDPDLVSADMQVWARIKNVSASLINAFMCVRLVDQNNMIGIQISGSGATDLRLVKYVTGSLTTLIQVQSTDEEWVRIKAVGTTISLWGGGTGAEPANPEEDTNWTQKGTNQTVTEHSTELSCGVANRATAAGVDFIDSFRAAPIGVPSTWWW